MDKLLQDVKDGADPIEARFYLNQAYTMAFETSHNSSFKNELQFIEVSPKEDLAIGSLGSSLARSYTTRKIWDIFHIDVETFRNLPLEKIREYEMIADDINNSPEARKANQMVDDVQKQIEDGRQQLGKMPGIKN